MIVALAGRRIDKEDAPDRFPSARAPEVAHCLRELLEELAPTVLVCSAACGADLLALEAAAQISRASCLQIRRRVVLPCTPDRFRTESVVDRGAEWGPRFDAVIADLRSGGDVVVIATESDPDYGEATERILDEATRLAGEPDAVVGVAVWEGSPRGESDYTAQFVASCERRGIRMRQVDTLR